VTPRLEVAAAGEWAAGVAADLAARIRASPALRVCLPTGDTPAPVYRALGALARTGAVSFADVEIVLLDEYLGLAPGDPARCDGRLRRELLDGLQRPPRAFHRIDVDGPDPVAAARAHDAVAARGLDLTLLGLGMNGHIGLNEPGTTPTDPTRVVDVEPSSSAVAVERYGAATPPTRGITIGIGRLLASSEIWLLVTGERKAAILRRVLDGPETPEVPATYLRRHGSLRILADDAAAPGP
jgi:glucosamine-6-phosphate deaminase